MSSISVFGLLFDEENELKCAAHAIAPRQIVALLANDFVVARNRKHRRGSHLLVGRDAGGECLAVPIEATADHTVWRPITAWYCKPSEESLLG